MINKYMRHIFAALACFTILPSSALASASPSGNITFLHIHNGGQVIFEQGGARNGAPSCATINNRWAFDGTTPAGQAKLSLIISLYISGKPAAVHGTGNCDVWGDTETVDFIGAPV